MSDETLLLVFDVLVLGVCTSDETLPLVFDILVLCVWISDETLLLVFDNSQFFDTRWNAPPRVWYISSRCLNIRWYAPPRVWYISSRCLNIRWYAPPRVWYISSRCLNIRSNAPSRVDILLVDVSTSDQTLSLLSDLSRDPPQDSVQFRASFMGPLPLQEYYELIDAHFEVRLQLPDFFEWRLWLFWPL